MAEGILGPVSNGRASSSFICSANQSVSRSINSLANIGVTAEVNITPDEEIQNKKYKEKCNRLQKQIRRLVFINNAIHSELNQCLTKLSKASDERRFLLNKILRFQKDVNQETISSRILQEALSKKQNIKYSSVSISSQSSQTSGLISPSQTTQINKSGAESEVYVPQSSHSSQQLCGKPQNERKPNSQTNDWTQISQTVNSESQTSVGVSNKRIKLTDSQITL